MSRCILWPPEKTAGKISHLQRWTQSHLDPELESFQYCMNEAYFSFSVLESLETVCLSGRSDP